MIKHATNQSFIPSLNKHVCSGLGSRSSLEEHGKRRRCNPALCNTFESGMSLALLIIESQVVKTCEARLSADAVPLVAGIVESLARDAAKDVAFAVL